MTFRTEQQAEYRGPTQEAADDAFRADVNRAVAAGFQPGEAQRRDVDGEHVLTITYHYQPPAVLVRSYPAVNSQLAMQWFSQDATALSAAGYNVTAQSWAGSQGNTMLSLGLGVMGEAMQQQQGALTATYVRDANRPPTGPIPQLVNPFLGPQWVNRP